MRSSARVVLRLAGRNLRRRPGQALLLLFVLCLATTTLTVATAVAKTGDAAWDRVWAQTNGGQIIARLFYPDGSALSPAALADVQQRLAGLATDPAVAAVGGPWPDLSATGQVGAATLDLTVEVRDPAPSAVDQPHLTSGRWLGAGSGAVLEDGLARTLHVGPGDTVVIAGRRLAVLGTASTVSRGRFPLSAPGLVWVARPDGELLRAGGARDAGATLELRLADAGDVGGFVAAHGGTTPGGPDRPVLSVTAWQQQRAGSHADLDVLAATLLGVATLLAGLTVAIAGVLVTGRMAAQLRQVGTLKAVGLTPAQVTSMLLVEHLALAGAAAVIGLAAGPPIAGWLSRSAVTLYGASAAPPTTGGRVVVVFAVAVAVVLSATIRPALRGIRRSTVRSLATDVRPIRRRSRLARLARRLRLPLPAVLGLRSAARRPGRTLLNTTGLTLAVATVVVGLQLHDSLSVLRSDDRPSHAAVTGLLDQIRTIVVAAAVVLTVLAVLDALVIAVFAARDNARNHAVLRTVGATTGQITVILVVAQLGACLTACAIGIPLGIGLFTMMAGGDLPPVRPSGSSLAAVAILAPLVFAVLVGLPARAFANRPIASQLSHE
jgi:putative ABC transport system permease protein